MSNTSFHKSARLLNAAEYSGVFSNHFRVRVGPITAWVSKAEGPQPRLGLVIAKKQFKRAVMRNRIKRLFREGFRHHQTQLPNRDVVMGAYKGFESLSKEQVCEHLETVWSTIARRSQKHS